LNAYIALKNLNQKVEALNVLKKAIEIDPSDKRIQTLYVELGFDCNDYILNI
jgi:hypothetical protein